MKVLANDGISQSGIDALQAKNGFDVITTNVAQEQLAGYRISMKTKVSGLLVRSATTARKDLVRLPALVSQTHWTWWRWNG